VILAEHAVFIGFYTFSRTTHLASDDLNSTSPHLPSRVLAWSSFCKSSRLISARLFGEQAIQFVESVAVVFNWEFQSRRIHRQVEYRRFLCEAVGGSRLEAMTMVIGALLIACAHLVNRRLYRRCATRGDAKGAEQKERMRKGKEQRNLTQSQVT